MSTHAPRLGRHLRPRPAARAYLKPPSSHAQTRSLARSELPQGVDALAVLAHSTYQRTLRPSEAGRGTYLLVGEGEQARLLALEPLVTHLGRGLTAHMRIDEAHVSRSHAFIIRHGHYLRLLDNRSSHGTFVNGRRILATNIGPGDELALAGVTMRVHQVGDGHVACSQRPGKRSASRS